MNQLLKYINVIKQQYGEYIMQAPVSGRVLQEDWKKLYPKWWRVAKREYKVINYRDAKYLNDIINSVNKYIKEEVDSWSNPYEFAKNKGGDCEDFAIAKYFFLKKNFPAYIVIGGLRDLGGHAVCVVYDKKYEAWIVLDCMTSAIRTWEQYQEIFTPMYVLDKDGVYV